MKIDHNIPIPLSNMLISWPFKAMAINDSVFITGFTHERITATCHGYAKKAHKTFKTRTQVEDGIKGVRVWRTS